MTDASEQSLGARTTSGVAWTAVQKWAVRITGFVTIAVLARLLTPADFGLVALASTIIPLLYLLSDLGFSTYITQAESVDRKMLSTSFWFSVLVGAPLSLGLAIAAPRLALLLSAPGLGEVLIVLSSAVFLVAVASVPVALLRRRMEFRRLAVISAIAALAGQFVAIAAALVGWGVWALVLQLIVNQAVMGALAWIAAKWRPEFYFSRFEFVKMARFGVNVVGVEFVALVRLWAETAIVTAFLGVTGLGYLNIAQRLIQTSQDLTVSAITPVTLVAFAKIRDSAERLRSAYVRVMEVTYAVSLPFVVTICLAAPVIVPLVFGEAWTESVVPSQAYAIASFMVVGAIVDKALFFGIGKPGSWFFYAVATDIFTVAITSLAVRFGLDAVAWGFVLVALLALMTRVLLVSRLVDASLRIISRPFARASVIGLGAGAVVKAVLLLTVGLPQWIILSLVGISFLCAYVPLLRWVLPSTFSFLYDTLRRAVKRGKMPTARQGGRTET